jgi:hypothetical protein
MKPAPRRAVPLIIAFGLLALRAGIAAAQPAAAPDPRPVIEQMVTA